MISERDVIENGLSLEEHIQGRLEGECDAVTLDFVRPVIGCVVCAVGSFDGEFATWERGELEGGCERSVQLVVGVEEVRESVFGGRGEDIKSALELEDTSRDGGGFHGGQVPFDTTGTTLIAFKRIVVEIDGKIGYGNRDI